MSTSFAKSLRHAAVATLLATGVAACSSSSPQGAAPPGSAVNDGVQTAPHEGPGQLISPSPTSKQGGG
jgi:hypothetical protein